MPDYSQKPDLDEHADHTVEVMMQKPRIGFLIASAIAALLAVAAYVFEDQIVGGGPGNSGISFAFLLISLVLAAIFLLLCYRVPRIGNRLLGYHKLNAQPKITPKSDVQYSAGFKAETGVETKQLNSRRKQARHSRKKLAAVTREMQQKAASKDDGDLGNNNVQASNQSDT